MVIIENTPSARELRLRILVILGLILTVILYHTSWLIERRQYVILDEANAIHTVYLRLELLPSNKRSEAQELIKLYLIDRIRATESSSADTAMQHSNSEKLLIQLRTVVNFPDAGVAPPYHTLIVQAVDSMITKGKTVSAVTESCVLSLDKVLQLIPLAFLGLLVGYFLSEARTKKTFYMLLGYSALALGISMVGIELYYHANLSNERKNALIEISKQIRGSLSLFYPIIDFEDCVCHRHTNSRELTRS